MIAFLITAMPAPTPYYASCYVAGGLSSSIRWVLSPLELTKMRLQTSNCGGTGSILSTMSSIYHTEGGWQGLFRGLGPTAAAYWLQTSTKYGLYEVLKDQYQCIAETNNIAVSEGLIYVSAAATAEAVADVLMCPFETIKCHVQTRNTGPSRLAEAFRSIVEMNCNRTFLSIFFQSLPALWARQIPGTVINFYTFESTVQFIYSHLPYEKSAFSWPQQLFVTFCAGYTAGFFAAVLSHPAHSLVSYVSTTGQNASTIIRTVGIWRLATQGLAPRIVVTGSIISWQWLLHDTFKSTLGYGTSGGENSAK